MPSPVGIYVAICPSASALQRALTLPKVASLRFCRSVTSISSASSWASSFSPLLGLTSGQFLQPRRAGGAAETFNVVALSIVLLNAVFVAEGRRLRDAQAAGVGSIHIKGIEGCDEEAVVYDSPSKEMFTLSSHIHAKGAVMRVKPECLSPRTYSLAQKIGRAHV